MRLLVCPMTVERPDDGATSSFIAFAGLKMTMSTTQPAFAGDTVYQRTARVKLGGRGRGLHEVLDVGFDIEIVPVCQLSPILQVAPLEPMSTPVFGNVFQELSSLYSHTHRAVA